MQPDEPMTPQADGGETAMRSQARAAATGILCLLLVAGLLTAAAMLAFGASIRPQVGNAPVGASTAKGGSLPFSPDQISTSDPAALETITAGEAIVENASRPVSTLPNPAAKALIVPQTDGENYQRSLDCLTAAVYYEAGAEPEAGQRSVAQVVLNRVRHPLYPNTVCGVVFQGSERRTGCQFTFTCDGSLAHIPSVAIWQRARMVAEEALTGTVWSAAGLATHYHADYVVPYWAASMVKLAVVGRHIFYRFAGGYGSPPAYNQAYGNAEPRFLERYGNGRFALLGDGSIQPDFLDPATAPVARPILGTDGRIIATAPESGLAATATRKLPGGSDRGETDKGALAARRDRQNPVIAPGESGAVRSWVIGMDGSQRRPSQVLAEP